MKLFLVLVVLTAMLAGCGPTADTAGDVIVPGTAANLTPTPTIPAAPTPAQAAATARATSVPAIDVPATVQAAVSTAKALATAVPTAAPSATPVVLVVQADQIFNIVGALPAISDFRAAVRAPGDTAKFIINFTVPMTNVVLSRVWPDDILQGAFYGTPGASSVELMPVLQMITVTKTAPADPVLRAVLKARGVNIVDGELLAQNKNSVLLGSVPAGAMLVFFVKDDTAKQVNRGCGAVLTNVVDQFTLDLTGKPVPVAK